LNLKCDLLVSKFALSNATCNLYTEAAAEAAQVEVALQEAVAVAMVEGGDIQPPQVSSHMIAFHTALKIAEAEVIACKGGGGAVQIIIQL
jgi:hypothetical protein